MNIDIAKKRIDKLKKEISKHRYNYHVLDKETISPEALDSLKKELFELEMAFPGLITPDSPTQRMGGKPLDKFKKVRHEKPMLSFNDAFSEGDMRAWLERLNNYLGYSALGRSRYGFYCELKIDGIAVELVYEKGKLVLGATRGDGFIGEDITANLKTIEAVPLAFKTNKMNPPSKTVVRGEVFITKKEFKRINEERKKAGFALYANPRNITAGSVRQLDPAVVAERNLDFFAYGIAIGFETKTHEEEHIILENLGFKTEKYSKKTKNLEEVFEMGAYWESHRDALPYEVDGIVVALNENKIFKKAGAIGKAPRGAIAFKFSPREATTTVKDIKIQVGRTGTLTPVAVLEPVELGGVTISRASLHNADQVERLDVRVGDTVVVSRAGDVIPQVTKVLKNLREKTEKKFKMPDKCPIDGSAVVKDGAIHRCSNPGCGARNRELIAHFTSRGAININGLGPKIINKFIDEGLMSDAADIFTLKKGDIAVLAGFGEKSAENILEETEKRKNVSVSRFLYGLGILHVGEETASILAKEVVANNEQPVTKPTELLRALKNWSMDDLQTIRDIGPKVAKSIYDWTRETRNVNFLKKLDKAGITIISEKGEKKTNKLKNKTFVLTGALDSMARENAKERIRSLGGKVVSAVSASTDYLIVGKDPGSKYDKAKELGIKILREKDFLEIISKN